MSQLSVLIIDDDRDASECLRDFLRLEGHQVFETTKPTEALEILKEKDIHIVVLDLMMPEVSGMELLPKIRHLDDDVAVIILTGYPNVDTASKSMEHEVSAYISKPCKLEDFRDVIGRIARKKGLLHHGEDSLHLALGERIREARKKAGLTLKQLARRTDLSVSLLSQIERAESSASVSSLFKVAVALGMKLQDLFRDF